MIELLRYARVKPAGLVSAKLLDGDDVCVLFKRFDVENGKEVDPEECVFPYADLVERLKELKKELVVVEELLALRK